MYTLSVKTLKRDDDVECTTTFSFPPGLNENRNLNLKLHNGIETQSVLENKGFWKMLIDPAGNNEKKNLEFWNP